MAKPPRQIRKGKNVVKDVLLAALWNIEKWEDREVCHLYAKEFTSRENSKFTTRVNGRKSFRGNNDGIKRRNVRTRVT